MSLKKHSTRLISLALFVVFVTTLPLYSPAQTTDINIGADDWHRIDSHDGYVTGNGRIYAVGGLGQTVTRSGKSFLTEKSVSLTRLAWIIGPHYAVGNLGYGWELETTVEGQPFTWNTEEIISPAPEQPFWSIISENQELRAEIVDVIIEDEPVLLRQLKITRPAGTSEAHVQLFLPVYPDPRNDSPFQMWNGDPVDESRPSVEPDRLVQLEKSAEALVLVGAPRALWQEISTPIPDEEEYRRLFPPRALATSATSPDPGVNIEAKPAGLHIDLGRMQEGEQRTIGVWLVTASDSDTHLEETVVSKLKKWKEKDIEKVVERSRAALPEPILRRMDDKEDPLTTVIQSTTDLARATQAQSGCVLAQPYMYPMCYVRDQLGSFKILLAQAEYQRAYEAFAFYVAMQNRYGIQNAYDTTILPPDPEIWHSDANANDGHHRIAEVPSITILMARDYYKATGDLERIKPLYDRLAYNLRIQEPSPNGLLPSPGDESYTNTARTAPRDRTEMTDSNLLFIAASRFMSELADTLGYTEDAVEFDQTANQTEDVLMERLWVSDGDYFAYARDASDDPAGIDTRPALDSMLRWFWLEMSDPLSHIPQANLETVLDSLVNPLRIVPEVYDFTAGMDPGYLLYALSRSQNPLMHDAAQLMLRYASDTGLFAEYYAHEDGIITPFSGTLRPWESGINAHALVKYFLGMRPDIPNHEIYLQPHLPPDWDGWTTREIELYEEGTIKMTYERVEENRIVFDLIRHGGQNPIEFHIEFGGFNGVLESSTDGMNHKKDRPDILETSLIFLPSEPDDSSSQQLTFTILPE